jgi:hypothetical protein
MADLTAARPRIAAMSEAAIGKVRRLEGLARTLPQVAIETGHVIHGGLYARTIFVPAGVMITGAEIKIATLLVVSGDALVYLDGAPLRLQGYTVLPASAGRKQAFVALAGTHLTMVFPSDARSIDEAERQFTDEADTLASRRDAGSNHIVITGE